MDLKEEMYVRTTDYGITQVKGFCSTIYADYIATKNVLVHKKEIVKVSDNIIDLIEVGDYVNGHLVIKRHNDLMLEDTFDLVQDEEIKSIVKKEQFESMSYKVSK